MGAFPAVVKPGASCGELHQSQKARTPAEFDHVAVVGVLPRKGEDETCSVWRRSGIKQWVLLTVLRV